MFVVQCQDKPNAGALRLAHREAHLTFLRAHAPQVILAGPLQTEDRSAMIGSLLVLDLPDRNAVEAFLAQDPYTQASLFENVTILPFRKVLP